MNEKIDVIMLISATSEGFEKIQKDLAGADKAIAEIKKFSTAGNTEFMRALGGGQASLKNFGNMLVQAGDKMGLGTSALYKMAGATGIYTDTQLSAARASANVAAKADELARAVSAGSMTSREAGKAFRDYADTQIEAASATGVNIESLKDFAKFAGGALAVVTALGVVVKKGFEFGAAGAQIELLQRNFDSLATSIGTTSTALLTDLRAATKGMASDAQLMQSATDMVGLGLAKTHDEAVRLSRVASQLGLNMNQLVLTLTNQTTMRFDALGLSVDGFEEKVKKLEDAGHSTNEAFKLAFLETAEAKLERIGDISQTNAGKINQMTAAWGDLVDGLKVAAAPAAGGLAAELTNLIPLQAETIDWSTKQVKVQKGVERVYIEVAGQLRDVTGIWNSMTDAQRANTSATHTQTEATKEAVDVMYDYRYVVTDVDHEARRAAQATANFADAADKAKKPVTEFLDGIDRDIASPIADFIKDLQWLAAGGGTIEKAFEDLKKNAPNMAPEQVQEFANQLLIAAKDVEVTLDPTKLRDASADLEDTLGKAAGRVATQYIKGTDGIEGALAAVTGIQYYLDFHFRYHGTPPSAYTGGGNLTVDPKDNSPIIGAGGAHGLNMTVPPGYPNDSFLIGATSGEKVVIMPPMAPAPAMQNQGQAALMAGAAPGGDFIVENMIFNIPRGANPNGMARTFAREAVARNKRRGGVGYSG